MAICASEKPAPFASFKSSMLSSPGRAMIAACSLINWICRKYHGSILQAAKISSIVAPAHKARCTCCKRYSVGTARADKSSCSSSPFTCGHVNIASLRSSDRSAFINASENERPIAIASPTLFMVVVRRGSASANFSKANRGTFTTT